MLTQVFAGDRERWESWLREQLSRGNRSQAEAAALAQLMAPFFVQKKVEMPKLNSIPPEVHGPRRAISRNFRTWLV